MRNLFVLKGVSDFAPGAFENTAVENGAIQLGQRGGEYLGRGSYTSPAMHLSPFTRLLAGWNADTPPGTTVEVQVRVASQRRWSRWLSFGTWSPFLYRGSVEKQEDEFAELDVDELRVTQQGVVCDTAQVRIILHTEEPKATPLVRLLAVTVRPDEDIEEEAGYAGRTLFLPGYSSLVRDPSISSHIASATTLTMLMNRWGEDVLPEETARAMYDTVSGRYNNRAFLSAAGGMYSYECYPLYCGVGPMRDEIQHGRCVAAYVRYRAPALGEAEGEEQDGEEAAPVPEETDGVPMWDEATVDSSGHLVAVRGFKKQNGEELVVINDPLAPSDTAVERELPLELFLRMYTGLTLFLHKGPKGAGKAKPERKLTSLELENGEVQLSVRGELLQPGENIPVRTSRATIAYTLDDGVAYASAAQKKFYYIFPGEDGAIPFDPSVAEGKKLTFYLIGSRGTTWVAEKFPPKDETLVIPGAKKEAAT